MKITKITALLLIFVLSLGLIASCGGGSNEVLGTGSSLYAESRNIDGRDISYVEMSVKGYGKAIILLDATSAPKTVANFLSLVEDGFYNGLTFHRIIKDFMIQGGDPKGDGSGGSKNTIKGEFSENGFENDIKHYPGVISMARSSNMDSASSQFFICNADARESLDGKYAAFGYVVMGMSVIEAITEQVFPKTAYANFYGNGNIYAYDSYGYPITYHQIWASYGNGAVQNKKDKPVIEYIKVLENYSHIEK